MTLIVRSPLIRDTAYLYVQQPLAETGHAHGVQSEVVDQEVDGCGGQEDLVSDVVVALSRKVPHLEGDVWETILALGERSGGQWPDFGVVSRIFLLFQKCM